MAELDLVKTGISGLDAILSSGIPRGNVILLEGGIGTGKTTHGRRVRLSRRQHVRRTRHHRPVRSLARQTRARCGVLWVGSPGARAPAQTQNHLHDTPGVPAGAAAGRQSAPRGGGGDRRPPHLRGRRGRRRQRRRRCGASRLLSRPRRGAAAREPHGRLRGRSDVRSTGTVGSRCPKNRLPTRSSG